MISIKHTETSCFNVFCLGASFLLMGSHAWSQNINNLDCILEPNKRIEISSPVEGVAKEVFVDRGDAVKRGDKLMVLRADLEEAELELAAARAEFGSRTRSRNDDIASLISDHEKDEIETDAKLAALELNEARVRLDMKTLRSPIDGIVVDRKITEGEFVSDSPVMTVVSIEPLFVEIIAPLELFGRLRVGDPARVKPEAPVSGRFDAKILVIDPVIDGASGTFRIRLALPNPDGTIPSGLRCQVSFPTLDSE